MDRIEIVARLARLAGMISQHQETDFVSRCRLADDATAEDWAVQDGLLGDDDVRIAAAQAAASTFSCQQCRWVGKGRDLAGERNDVLCPKCGSTSVSLVMIVTHPGIETDGERVRWAHHLPGTAPEADMQRPATPRSIDKDSQAGLRKESGPMLESSPNGSGPTPIREINPGISDDIHNLPPDTVLDSCRIEEWIAEGGMGVIYRAVDTYLDRKVAIKIISAGVPNDPSLIERFKLEARAVARLEHPNVVQIYRLGEIKGRPYIVMQWIDGESIGDRMARLGKLSVEETLDVLMQSAAGLAAAHAQGIIHRDIKPDNLLCTRDGVVKVADFGLARVVDANMKLSQTGLVVGTPTYMSPEQASEQPLDGRADVYSMAIASWHMLTGDAPFKSQTVFGLIQAHATTPLPPARTVRPDIPEDVDKLLRQMAEKRPDDRPRSMAEVVERAQALLIRHYGRTPRPSSVVDTHRALASKPGMTAPATDSGTGQYEIAWYKRLPAAAAAAAMAAILVLALAAVFGAFGGAGTGNPRGDETGNVRGPDRTTDAERRIEQFDFSTLPPYEKQATVEGEFETRGSSTMGSVMTAWADGFRVFHPQAFIAVGQHGSSSAVPALLSGRAQFGQMSRPMKQQEIAAFERQRGYEPTRFVVCIDTPVVFVHRTNPITRMSLEELDAIYSSTRSSGYPERITSWGGLGLTGEWGNRSIAVYNRDPVSGTYEIFRKLVLKGGEFGEWTQDQPGNPALVDRVAADPAGIGYGTLDYMNEQVKSVPLSLHVGGEAVQPTVSEALGGTYPLSRQLMIYVDRKPGEPLSDIVREFMRFVLSRDGQRIAAEHGFLPLPEFFMEPLRDLLR